MGATNGIGLLWPELTDSADGPDAFSKLANGVEDYFFDRILPSGVARAPEYYWGSGTSLPNNSLVRVGDTYFHTGTRSLYAWTLIDTAGAGTYAWRQIGPPPRIADLATARTIVNNFLNTPAMYYGWQAWVITLPSGPSRLLQVENDSSNFYGNGSWCFHPVGGFSTGYIGGSADFIAGGTYTAASVQIATVAVADPGFVYRLDSAMQGEMGAQTSTSTRYDFYMDVVGRQYGQTANNTYRQGFTLPGALEYQWQRLRNLYPTPQYFIGPSTVVFSSGRVYGSGGLVLSNFNRDAAAFVVT